MLFTLPSVFIMAALMVFPLVTTVYLSFHRILPSCRLPSVGGAVGGPTAPPTGRA
ncbi:MAG: hypothetical protein AAFN30_10645 [Actinomycetota bacterium]